MLSGFYSLSNRTTALQPNQHKMLSPDDTIITSRYGRNNSSLLRMSLIVEYFRSSLLIIRFLSLDIKQVPEKVATTCTEDGHKQTTKTSTTI